MRGDMSGSIVDVCDLLQPIQSDSSVATVASASADTVARKLRDVQKRQMSSFEAESDCDEESELYEESTDDWPGLKTSRENRICMESSLKRRVDTNCVDAENIDRETPPQKKIKSDLRSVMFQVGFQFIISPVKHSTNRICLGLPAVGDSHVRRSGENQNDQSQKTPSNPANTHRPRTAQPGQLEVPVLGESQR